MFSLNIKKNEFIYLTFITTLSYSWIFLISILVYHIEKIFDIKNIFYIFISLSLVSGIFSNIYFGKLLSIYGSKLLLIIGIILNILSWFIMMFSENIYFYIFSFILEGISYSSLLIARNQYVYNFLSHRNLSNHYLNLESKLKISMLFILTIITFLSTYLYEINNNLPFIFNIIIDFYLLFYLFYIKIDKDIVSEKIKNVSLIKILSNFIKDRVLLLFVLVDGIYNSLIPYLIFVFQSHLIEKKMDLKEIGVVISLVFLFRIFGALYISHTNIKHKTSLYNLFFISFLIFNIALLNNIYLISIIFLIVIILREYIEIYINVHLINICNKDIYGIIRSIGETISNIGILFIISLIVFLPDIFKNSEIILLLYSFLFLLTFILLYFHTLNLKQNKK